jgi:hypothetical protein
MKLKILFNVCLITILSICVIHAKGEIKVITNGNNVEFVSGQEPIIENGTTLIPMRVIFELLDADVNWDGDTSTVTALKNDKKIEIQNNSRYIKINNAVSEMPVKARVINNYMFIPLRVVGEALGSSVNWDGQTSTVIIEDYNTKKYNEQEFKVENVLFKKVAEQIDTVVKVDLLDNNNKVLDSFGGVVITNDGYIVTNFLSFDDNTNNIRVTFINNKTVDIEDIKYNKGKKFIVIKVNKKNLKSAKIDTNKNPNIGETVAMISNPFNMNYSLSNGLFTGYKNIDEIEYIQSSVSIASTSSGGGLFDLEGNLLGIEKIGHNNENLFIKIGDILEYIDSLKKGVELYVTMYANDGRTITIKNSEIDAYKKVGWYLTKEEVTQTVYSLNGSLTIYNDELESYLQNGWKTVPYAITTTETCSFEINSVNGLKLAWMAKNTSNKIINYYTVTLYLLNPVDDPAYDEITRKWYKVIDYVGPVNQNENLLIYDVVAYSSTCDKIVIGDIEIIYADGTNEKFWWGQVAKQGSISSKWDGSIMNKVSN